jgi:hypothetical protein
MIISKKYAEMLVKRGQAEKIGTVTQDGKTYQVVNRFDIQRTDHYAI